LQILVTLSAFKGGCVLLIAAGAELKCRTGFQEDKSHFVKKKMIVCVNEIA